MEMIVTNTLTLIFLFLAIECEATSHQQATSTTVRLTGFNSTVFGRVEIHSNGTWSVPCSDEWTLKNSFVACKTLGYNHAIMINNDHLRSSLASSVDHKSTITCDGDEDSLSHCTSTTSDDAQPHCNSVILYCSDAKEGALRLVGPGGDGEGSVEMYSARYGWSSLCTSGWDDDDATVVCNELGYDYGESNTILISSGNAKRYNNFQCTSTEARLTDCSSDGPFPGGCTTASRAVVVCTNHEEDSYTCIGFLWQVAVFALVLILCVPVPVLFILALICLKQKRYRKSLLQNEQRQGDDALQQTDPWEYIPEPAPPSYSESCSQEAVHTAENITGSTSDSEQVDQDRTSNTDLVNSH